MFAVIDLNMLEYCLSIITTCISLDLFNLECNSAGSNQPEGNDGANLQPEYSNASHAKTPASGHLLDHPATFPTAYQPLLPPQPPSYMRSATQLSFSSSLAGLVPDQFHYNDTPPLSLDPPPQHESDAENIVSQPSGLYSCKGTWIQWLPGSIWDTYAYAQHELSHVTWQLARTTTGFV
jgi:hypothetical protein